jgi:putative DNA primase/helicase
MSYFDTIKFHSESQPDPKDVHGFADQFHLDSIPPEPIDWLWPFRIPRGCVSLLTGPPGSGKSLVALDLAARLSRGRPWPDQPDGQAPYPFVPFAFNPDADEGPTDPDAPPPPPPPPNSASVMLVNAEDDLARTICPRLAVLGADLRRLVALGADTFNAHGYSGPVEFPQDLRQLERFLNKCGQAVRLVIIDPLAAFLGRADATSNKAIRKLMASLSQLAQRTDTAILCVAHHTKRSQSLLPIDRPLGSVAMTGVARAVWAVVPHDTDPERRTLLPLKNNYGPLSSPLTFRIHPCTSIAHPTITWDEPGPPLGTSGGALRADSPSDAARPFQAVRCDTPSGHRRATPVLDKAVALLTKVLAHGPVHSLAVTAAAEAHLISREPLRKAMDALGITTHCEGTGIGPRSKWFWSLPTTSDP